MLVKLPKNIGITLKLTLYNLKHLKTTISAHLSKNLQNIRYFLGRIHKHLQVGNYFSILKLMTEKILHPAIGHILRVN